VEDVRLSSGSKQVGMKLQGYNGTSTQRFLKSLEDHRLQAEEGSQKPGAGGGPRGGGNDETRPLGDGPGFKEQNISEGWLSADDPAASTMAPSEVLRQVEMPSRWTHAVLPST